MPAKKKGSKPKGTAGTTRWQAQPDDAIRLAALRWFALELEALAIEIYASDKARFEEMEHELRHCVRRMRRMRKAVNVIGEENCPNGYILCMDGLCAPMCDHLTPPIGRE